MFSIKSRESRCLFFIFFFNDTATTEIYTLSLHDALPISGSRLAKSSQAGQNSAGCVPGESECGFVRAGLGKEQVRSEEHTSELQSRQYLVCRLLLEKKNKNTFTPLSRLLSSACNYLSLIA